MDTLKDANFHAMIDEEQPPVTPLPNRLLVVIKRINDNIIRDWNSKDPKDPLLPYFLANGSAYYDNLFMPGMMEEVKAEQRGQIKGSSAKELQEIMEVSSTDCLKKPRYNLSQCRMTRPACGKNRCWEYSRQRPEQGRHRTILAT